MLRVQECDSVVRRKRSDATGKTRDKKRLERPFIGWDGEGFTHDGKHYYGLFGNSNGLTVKGLLDWETCLPLLFQETKHAYHVIYAGVYDAVMMFRTLPTEQVNSILKALPTRVGKYRILYMRGKSLRVTDMERKETRTLFDVFSFFGGSFVNACREYLGSADILDEIEAMKLQRNTFTIDTLKSGATERYMAQELEMLVKLCDTLRQRLSQVGITLSSWHGPGAVASAVLKREKVAQRRGTYGDIFRVAAEAAYYGGRFEQFQRGTYEGDVYQYDIRSAYPSAMVYLRDLSDTEWVYKQSKPRKLDPYSLYQIARVNGEESYSEVGRLPHRSLNGSIYYPPHFSIGWYWGVELEQSDMDFVTAWYDCQPQSEPGYPFRFVEEMYRQRSTLKKANQPQQLALKLALNSLYGKLAQSKGATITGEGWQFPSFHESVWSGWITAYTRSKIRQALTSVPRWSIIATETDSVFSTEPINGLEVGTALGQWELQVLDGIKYVQSGVSLVLSDDEWKVKSRGFTLRKGQNEPKIWNDFLAQGDNGILPITQTRFGTDPRRKSVFGQWYSTTHNIQLSSGTEKRIHSHCSTCDISVSMSDAMHYLYCPPIPPTMSKGYPFIWRRVIDDQSDALVEEIPLEADDPILTMEYT